MTITAIFRTVSALALVVPLVTTASSTAAGQAAAASASVWTPVGQARDLGRSRDMARPRMATPLQNGPIGSTTFGVEDEVNGLVIVTRNGDGFAAILRDARP